MIRLSILMEVQNEPLQDDHGGSGRVHRIKEQQNQLGIRWQIMFMWLKEQRLN